MPLINGRGQGPQKVPVISSIVERVLFAQLRIYAVAEMRNCAITPMDDPRDPREARYDTL